MKVAFHEVQVVSDLYEAGRQDDGVPFVAERYEIEVTFPRGDRYRLNNASWNGAQVVRDEDGPFFVDIRAEALACALHVRRAIRRRGSIDLSRWTRARPVYGSPAYCSADDVELERLEEEAA